jgi:hypothetical protein
MSGLKATFSKTPSLEDGICIAKMDEREGAAVNFMGGFNVQENNIQRDQPMSYVYNCFLHLFVSK